eukprot:7091992-Alexandrium_andersonii.AAC.1
MTLQLVKLLASANHLHLAAGAEWRSRPRLTLWNRCSLGWNRHSTRMHHRRPMLWHTVLPLLAVVMPLFA